MLPTPASKKYSLTLLLFIVIIGKNFIQRNGFHAGNHIFFQLFVGIIQHWLNLPAHRTKWWWWRMNTDHFVNGIRFHCWMIPTKSWKQMWLPAWNLLHWIRFLPIITINSRKINEIFLWSRDGKRWEVRGQTPVRLRCIELIVTLFDGLFDRD